MESFKNQENVLRLIDEAVKHTGQLEGTYKSELMPDFVQAHETLITSSDFKSQIALILSATRILIAKAEKKTIRLIIGDDFVTGQQMSHLVRIRLICAELLGLLNTTLDRMKKPGAASRSA
jgi:hypothetical protein